MKYHRYRRATTISVYHFWYIQYTHCKSIVHTTHHKNDNDNDNDNNDNDNDDNDDINNKEINKEDADDNDDNVIIMMKIKMTIIGHYF